MSTLSNPAPSPLVARWHRQIGRRRPWPGGRSLVALDLQVRGGGSSSLVPVERLSFLVLHDAVDGDLRFAMYGARRIPWGVALGGVESHRLERNAALEPLHWARENRLDASDRWLLKQALRMDRRVDRHHRSARSIERDRPSLPTFWAAFSPDVAESLDGDGPELNGLVHETGRSAEHLLTEARRGHDGLVLLPLAWVSHHWELAADVYADLEGVSQRQLFRLDSPDSLVGFRGACQFDFASSRFATPDVPALAG